MGQLTVTGRRSIANVQKVLWCLEELGIPYLHEESCTGDLEPRDRAYLDLKRAHVVPMMNDDGFVLWEGNAIARYLADKHGRGTLMPEDPRERADVERWMDYQLSTGRVHIHPLMREDLSDDEKIFHMRMMAHDMQVVEVNLQTRDYLAGANFTVADIPLGILAYRWFVLEIDRPEMPAIEAWYDRLRQRPAFCKTMIPPEDAGVPLRKSAG